MWFIFRLRYLDFAFFVFFSPVVFQLTDFCFLFWGDDRRKEERVHSDALMALDEGKSLRTLFQKPEEVAKEKKRRAIFAVLGITGIIVLAIVTAVLLLFIWRYTL